MSLFISFSLSFDVLYLYPSNNTFCRVEHLNNGPCATLVVFDLNNTDRARKDRAMLLDLAPTKKGWKRPAVTLGDRFRSLGTFATNEHISKDKFHFT